MLNKRMSQLGSQQPCWRCGSLNTFFSIQSWGGKNCCRVLCYDYPRCIPKNPECHYGELICDICNEKERQLHVVIYPDSSKPYIYCHRCISELSHWRVLTDTKIYEIGQQRDKSSFPYQY